MNPQMTPMLSKSRFIAGLQCPLRLWYQCFNPYKCEFFEHCTSGMPEFWVMNLSGITQEKFNRINNLPFSFSNYGVI